MKSLALLLLLLPAALFGQDTLKITVSDSVWLNESHSSNPFPLYELVYSDIAETVDCNTDFFSIDIFNSADVEPSLECAGRNVEIYLDVNFDTLVYSLYSKEDTFSIIKYNNQGYKIHEGNLIKHNAGSHFYRTDETQKKDISWLNNWTENVIKPGFVAVGEWKFYYKNEVLGATGSYNPLYVIEFSDELDPFSLETRTSMTIPGYTDALKTGIWKYYDPSGKLILTQTIENGTTTGFNCQ